MITRTEWVYIYHNYIPALRHISPMHCGRLYEECPSTTRNEYNSKRYVPLANVFENSKENYSSEKSPCMH